MRESIDAKILNLEDIKRRILGWRIMSQSLVFTNGCFDLLHLGHLHYLIEAQALGDRLIIGLNSDESVRNLKGAHRPIHDFKSRATMLACMSFVDAVVIFEEDTPINLIEAIVPDVLVKGGDYKPNQIVGYDVVNKSGGIVKTLSFVEGYSSTNIESRIRGQA